MEEEDRKKLYEYAVKIGFIIKGAEDWKESKKIMKLRQYIRQGFRIVDYGNDFEVINIFDKVFSDRKRKVIEELYEWIASEDKDKQSEDLRTKK